MKIYVMVDMEGISGIVNPEQVMNHLPYYNEGRQYATWEANACVQGCLDGGATEIIVRDAHYTGKNFIWHELHEKASYVTGSAGEDRFPGLDGSDGLILLGYHAMAGTAEAVLEHTMSSEGWQNFWVNGKRFGEIGIDMSFAAERGVPLIMVSGDDKTCAEALSLVPDIVTAQVKQAHSLTGATLLSKQAAHGLIRQMSAEAVRKCKMIKPKTTDTPVTIRLEMVERKPIPSQTDKPYMKVIDARTYEVTGESFKQAYQRL